MQAGAPGRWSQARSGAESGQSPGAERPQWRGAEGAPSPHPIPPYRLLQHQVELPVLCSNTLLPTEWKVLSSSVLCDSVTPWTVARLLSPCNSPDMNTGVGCHFLLPRISSTQGSDLCLLCSLHAD